MLGKYKVTQGVETSSIDANNRTVYHFRISVVESPAGQVVQEFRAIDLDRVRAAVRAVDEMMAWLKNAPE